MLLLTKQVRLAGQKLLAEQVLLIAQLKGGGALSGRHHIAERVIAKLSQLLTSVCCRRCSRLPLPVLLACGSRTTAAVITTSAMSCGAKQMAAAMQGDVFRHQLQTNAATTFAAPS